MRGRFKVFLPVAAAYRGNCRKQIPGWPKPLHGVEIGRENERGESSYNDMLPAVIADTPMLNCDGPEVRCRIATPTKLFIPITIMRLDHKLVHVQI